MRWLLPRLLGACSVVPVVYVAVAALHRHSAARAFVELLEIANSGGLNEVSSVRAANPRNVRLVVFSRDIDGSPRLANSRYTLQHGLSWHAPLASSSYDATVVLLVDKIEIDVRSYQPRGEDFQSVLHVTLLTIVGKHILLEFTAKGNVPGRREGMSGIFGHFNRHGREPWPQVIRRVEAKLGVRPTAEVAYAELLLAVCRASVAHDSIAAICA